MGPRGETLLTSRLYPWTRAEAEMRDVANFLRTNPQAAVLLLVCIVLGLGTFLVVIIALATSGSTTTDGEPSGTVLAFQGLMTAAKAVR